MVMTLNIPDSLVEAANARGISVEQLLSEREEGPVKNDHNLTRPEPPPGFRYIGVPTMTPDEAVAAIHSLASKHRLNGLKIKDLIEEGRRH